MTYSKYESLFAKIEQLMAIQEVVNVAIDGPSGAGKSSLAAFLHDKYDCNIFHMDFFFLPQELRTPARFREPGGNIHYERFASEVLEGIRSREKFQYGVFDCKQMAVREYVSITPKQLNVIEGCYSLHPALDNIYDVKVFLSIEPDVQQRRIRERDGVKQLGRFLQEWIPLEQDYIKTLHIHDKCDFVFE